MKPITVYYPKLAVLPKRLTTEAQVLAHDPMHALAIEVIKERYPARDHKRIYSILTILSEAQAHWLYSAIQVVKTCGSDLSTFDLTTLICMAGSRPDEQCMMDEDVLLSVLLVTCEHARAAHKKVS